MKCKVLVDHLVHDGERRAAGDEIDLPAGQVAALEEIGAVRRLARKPAAKGKAQAAGADTGGAG